MNPDQKRIALEKSTFRCAKCGFYSPIGKELQVIQGEVLCSVCSIFSPEDPIKFKEYLNEKLDWQVLDTFRKSGINRASHNVHKDGMIEGARKGKLMARPAYGYKVLNSELIPSEDEKENVRSIFEDFLKGQSLNQLSKQYGISVNGIKKILRNFTYLGKIKFAGAIVQGKHQPIISAELFNDVQRKLESKNNSNKNNLGI